MKSIQSPRQKNLAHSLGHLCEKAIFKFIIKVMISAPYHCQSLSDRSKERKTNNARHAKEVPDLVASSTTAVEERRKKELEARERTIQRLRGHAEYNAKAFDAVAVTLNHVVNTVSAGIGN